MDDESPDIAIRGFLTSSDEWNGWLANFPFLPGDGDWQLDYFLGRIGPWLRQLPDPGELTHSEREQLRTQMARYAGRLVGYQRNANWRGTVDWGLTIGSAVAGVFAPVLFVVSVATLARNTQADRAWEARRVALKSLANYLEQLI